MKLKRPDLVWKGYTKPSKRDKARPYVIGVTIALIIVLLAIKECA